MVDEATGAAAVEPSDSIVAAVDLVKTEDVQPAVDSTNPPQEEDIRSLPPAIRVAFFFLQLALCYWILFDVIVVIGEDLSGDALCYCAFATSTILYKPFGPVMWAVLMTVCSQAYFEHTVWETAPKKQPKGALFDSCARAQTQECLPQVRTR